MMVFFCSSVPVVLFGNLVSKFNVGLKTLLHQSLSEPEFYGDLVYKFKTIVGRADFSGQFRKIKEDAGDSRLSLAKSREICC